MVCPSSSEAFTRSRYGTVLFWSFLEGSCQNKCHIGFVCDMYFGTTGSNRDLDKTRPYRDVVSASVDDSGTV